MLFGLWALAWLPVGRVSAFGPHALALEEFGAGLPIAQVFPLTAPGLHSVRVRLTSSSPSDVRFEYRIATLTNGAALERYRGMRVVNDLAGAKWIDLDFAPIDLVPSTSVRLQLKAVRVEPHGAPNGPTPRVALVASRERPVRPSYLVVDGKDRPGSLQFDTRAAGDTALGRFQATALGQLSVWPPLVFVALLAYAALFFPLIGTLLPAGGTCLAEPGRRLLGFAVSAGLIAAMLVTGWVARRQHGRVNLVEQLYGAELESGWPLHLGMDALDVELGTRTLPAILELPPGRIAWHLTLPREARFRGSIGMLQMAWTGPGDGVNFRIVVERPAESVSVFEQYVDPAHVALDQRWIPVDVDLSRFAGQPVNLVLLTEPSRPGVAPDTSNDFALWGAPRID
jgi:hypothetical protein